MSFFPLKSFILQCKTCFFNGLNSLFQNWKKLPQTKRKEKKKPLMTSTLIAYKNNFCQNSMEKTYAFTYILIIAGPMMVVRCYLHSKWPNCEGPQACGLHKLLHANVLACTTQNGLIYASQRRLKSKCMGMCVYVFLRFPCLRP